MRRSTVVEYLKGRSDRNAEPVIYFFFDFNESKKQQIFGCVSSLISQLSWFRPSSHARLLKLYTNSRDGQEKPSLNDLLVLLDTMLKDFEAVYIVIDALDECEGRSDLLRSLIQIHAMNSSRILFTSRQEGSIETYLEDHLTHRIVIEPTMVDSDISLHIQQRVRRFPQKVRQEVQATLTKEAQGM